LNPKNFDNVNLNLLVIFAVLMRERSVTRASKILMISQPAVSHALKQLRALFADPLFTRTSTPRSFTRTCWYRSRRSKRS
jgi:LysR family transcriptional activator of mexEF-oprN operon